MVGLTGSFNNEFSKTLLTPPSLALTLEVGFELATFSQW